MNAPLPREVTGTAPQVYEQVARGGTHPAQALAAKLAQRLREHTQAELLFGLADRGRYATDASIYQVMPVGVMVPKSDDDVRHAIDICRDLGVPIIARGGGTSQCGQTTGAGLVIDTSKYLRQVRHLDVAARRVEVQPGIVLDHLNVQLKPHGLWYPVDVSTSAQATLGGMAGNNSCGSRSIAYGNMVHNVLGASAWLSDGELTQWGTGNESSERVQRFGAMAAQLAHELRDEIRANWPKVMRRVAGYNLDIFDCQSERTYTADGAANLAHMLIGSEGTLAVTRSLTLQLCELPRTKVLGVVNFPSFYKAMDSAQHIVKLGAGTLTAVELVDRTMIELSLRNPAFAPTVRTALIGEPEAILLVEFAGADKAALTRHLKSLVELMGDLGMPGSVVEMVDDTPQKNLWEVRKAGLNIMMSLRGDGKPVSFIEDCAVPLAHLAEYTDALTQVFAKHGTKGTWYAHASVGTLHVRPILDMRRDGGPKMRAIAEEASALVRQYKGAYSGEHGDGLCRGEWVQWQFGPRIHEAFARIKQDLDPLNLLCPQRIVDAPKMDERSLMRYHGGYRVIPLQPALDWSAWDVHNDPRTEATTAPGTGGDPAHGLAKAVEMCNNNGTCRKFDAGTMCPSYRVTRDEQHLTRGRANTLRLALSGQLGPEGIHSAEVSEAMDLCVGCKGCKRDCPTGVDMARMKIEVLAQQKAKTGWSLKDKLIAHLPRYAASAARLAPLLNLRNRVPLIAKWFESLTGMSAQRQLPEWSAQHFHRASEDHGLTASEVMQHAKPVVLFVDTFNGFFESDNARAAMRVLRAAGYGVHVASRRDPGSSQHLCCGRTYLSVGMVDEARAQMKALLAALLPFAEKGIAIVGLEPSCLLTLKDEALVMGLGEMAQTVAAHSQLIDDFLAAESRAGTLDALRSQLVPANKPVLVHGHCHQKAFGLTSGLMEVIQLIPQAKATMVESSCCGMAGSFGYEAAHQQVAMQMAELSLLPALRKDPDAWVVADGTSCRHQIGHGAQREALHLVQLLARHLP